jgi:hypothetical protein
MDKTNNDMSKQKKDVKRQFAIKCFEEHAWSQVLSPSFTSKMDNRVHQFLFMATCNFF